MAKRILFSALALVLAATASAQSDGLYYISVQETALSITTLDGERIFLGPRFSEKLDVVELMSLTNDNSRYDFILHQNKDADLENKPIAFVFGSTGLPFESAGGGKNDATRITSLSDPEAIRRVADYFHIQPLTRTHPGHRLLVKIVPKQSAYDVTDKVLVDFQITNCGTKTITLEPPLTIHTLEGTLSFEAVRCLPSGGIVHAPSVRRLTPTDGNSVVVKTGSPPIAYTFLGGHLVGTDPSRNISGPLAPGQTISKTVDLKDFITFDTPGDTYLVRGTCALEILKGDAQLTATAGIIRADLQWDDFATAEATIDISDKKAPPPRSQ